MRLVGVCSFFLLSGCILITGSGDGSSSAGAGGQGAGGDSRGGGGGGSGALLVQPIVQESQVWIDFATAGSDLVAAIAGDKAFFAKASAEIPTFTVYPLSRTGYGLTSVSLANEDGKAFFGTDQGLILFEDPVMPGALRFSDTVMGDTLSGLEVMAQSDDDYQLYALLGADNALRSALVNVAMPGDVPLQAICGGGQAPVRDRNGGTLLVASGAAPFLSDCPPGGLSVTYSLAVIPIASIARGDTFAYFVPSGLTDESQSIPTADPTRAPTTFVWPGVLAIAHAPNGQIAVVSSPEGDGLEVALCPEAEKLGASCAKAALPEVTSVVRMRAGPGEHTTIHARGPSTGDVLFLVKPSGS